MWGKAGDNWYQLLTAAGKSSKLHQAGLAHLRAASSAAHEQRGPVGAVQGPAAPRPFPQRLGLQQVQVSTCKTMGSAAAGEAADCEQAAT
jgi:hypothetical protein